MEIRILASKDAEKYQRLRIEALQNHPEAFSSSFEEEKDMPIQKTEERLNGKQSFTFGAFIEKDLIGVATLIVETKIKIKHRATIVAVYVHPSARNTGIGKKLMHELINQAKALPEIEQIYLTVTASNYSAKHLYNSLGFKTYGIEKKALKVEGTYFDDELMVLFLS